MSRNQTIRPEYEVQPYYNVLYALVYGVGVAAGMYQYVPLSVTLSYSISGGFITFFVLWLLDAATSAYFIRREKV